MGRYSLQDIPRERDCKVAMASTKQEIVRDSDRGVDNGCDNWTQDIKHNQSSSGESERLETHSALLSR